MDPYIGEIRLFAGNYAPLDWLFCWGQTVQVFQYQALYSLIGNTYGGTVNQTFVLPDLRGRVPNHQGVGPGLSTYVWSKSGGSTTVQLQTNQLGPHTHPVNGNISETSPGTSPDGTLWSITAGRSGIPLYNDTANTTLNVAAISAAGGGQAHNNMQPFIAINYIIATSGVYPVKSS